MEIERIPVTLDQRIAYLNQNAENKSAAKKTFPWSIAVISLMIGASLCLIVIYFQQSKKEEENKK